MRFTTPSKKVEVRGSIPQTEDILLAIDFRKQAYSEQIWGSGGAFQTYVTPMWERSNKPVCVLFTDKESPAEGDNAWFDTWVPLTASKNYRMVCLWRWGSTTDSYIQFRLYHRDGSYLYDARVRYVPSTDAWEYLDENNSWQTIGSQKLHIHTCHLLEFSVDFNTGKYKKLVSAGEEFDLSAYSMYKKSDTSELATGSQVHVYSDGTDYAEAELFWIYITEG